jgi:hypothetical protein
MWGKVAKPGWRGKQNGKASSGRAGAAPACPEEAATGAEAQVAEDTLDYRPVVNERHKPHLLRIPGAYQRVRFPHLLDERSKQLALQNRFASSSRPSS